MQINNVFSQNYLALFFSKRLNFWIFVYFYDYSSIHTLKNEFKQINLQPNTE